MKKSLIALTVASAAASTAFAVDLDDPTSSGTAIYASEIDVSGTGIEVNTTETAFSEVGFTVTDAAPRFFRYDLSNGGNFVTNPTLTFAAGTSCPNFAAPTVTLSTGGAGESFVLFEVASQPAPSVVCNDSIVTLNFGASPNLGLAGTTTVGYTLFEFGAGGGNGQLASAGPNTLAAFSPALAVGTSSVTGGAAELATETNRLIEVADDSLNFEGGGVDTALGSFYVALNDPTPLNDAGVAITVAEILSAHTVTVGGDFSAAKAVTLHLDSSGTTECGVTAPLFTAALNTAGTAAVFTPPVGEVGDLSMAGGVETVATVCMEVTGTDIINEGTYTGTYAPTANTGFTVGDVEFVLGALGNTGTTIPLHLTLTPSNRGGVYRNLVRVTNTSTNAGRVFFRMINDAGESSPTVTLGEVTGGTDMIPAQGSSQQVNVNAIYDAVLAADPTFSFGDAPSNKLRTIVTGEFGSMDVQTYTVSTDNTTFSTF